MIASSTRQVKEQSLGKRFQALAWWSSAQLDSVSIPLEAAWIAWSQAWLPDGAARGLALDCKMAHDRAHLAEAHWTSLGARGSAHAWIAAGEDGPVVALAQALFGKGQFGDRGGAGGEGIAESVAQRAWTDLRRLLRSALHIDEEPGKSELEMQLFRPWSGCVAIRLVTDGMSCFLLLNAQCVQTLLKASPHLAPVQVTTPKARPAGVENALAPRKIALRIELTACELELGSLQDLRVGDVVPLQHSLEAPLHVNLADGAPLCAAFLGKQGNKKAIELVRLAPQTAGESQPNHSQ